MSSVSETGCEWKVWFELFIKTQAQRQSSGSVTNVITKGKQDEPNTSERQIYPFWQ